MEKQTKKTLTLLAAVILLLLIQTVGAAAAAAAPAVAYSFDTNNSGENFITQGSNTYLIRGVNSVTIPVNLTIEGGTLYSYAVDAKLTGGTLPDLILQDSVSWTNAVNGHKLASTVTVNGGISSETQLFNIKLENISSLQSGSEYTLTIDVSSAAAKTGTTNPELIETTKTLKFKTARTITLKTNDCTKGTIGAVIGTQKTDCSKYSENTYTAAAPEGEPVVFKISPIEGHITESLKVNGTLTAGGSGNEYIIDSVTKDVTIEANFIDTPTDKKPEPEAPKSIRVTVTDDAKDSGVNEAAVHIDGTDEMKTNGEITINTVVNPPETVYTPVTDPEVTTVLIVEIKSNIQPLESNARVTLKIEKSRVNYPDTVKIYHNVQTSPGQWEQKEVQNQNREADDGDNYVYSFTTPSFSYFTFVEQTPPEPVPSPSQAPVKPSGGGGTDTGSGNYKEYPRTVTDGGSVSFGTSQIVTGVDLPKGTTGQVALIAESDVPAPEGKQTITVFEINVPNYPSGKESVIKFKLNLAEIEKAGYTPSDVCLYHCDGKGVWTKLPTTYIIKDGVVYYEAVTTAFSPFAIVYEEGASTSDENIVIPTAAAEPETDVTSSGPVQSETAQPTASASPIGLISLAAGLGAAVFVLRRK